MSVQVRWFDQKRSIAYMRCYGQWSCIEFDAGVQRLAAMRTQTADTLSVLLHIDSGHLPVNLLTGQFCTTWMLPDQIVVAGSSVVADIIADRICTQYPQTGRNLTRTPDVPSAVAYLQYQKLRPTA